MNVCFVIFVVSLCASVGLGALGPSPQAIDARQERLKAAVARVYDSGVLHRIEIVIAPDDAGKVLNRTSERVRCTFTFDGVTRESLRR